MNNIPEIGFGLWKIAPKGWAKTVVGGLKSVYCYFDCAADYGNEAEVGDGIRGAIDQGLVRRE